MLGLAGILLLFLGRQPAGVLMRRRSRDGNFGENAAALARGATLLIGAGALIFLLLILLGGYDWLLGLAAAAAVLFALHTYLSVRSRERAAPAEFAGILMLTLTAPLGFYLAGSSLSQEALWLWVLCFLYFGTSVWHVKAMLRAAARSGLTKHSPAANRSIAYLLFVIIVLAALTLAGVIPLPSAIGYVPAGIWVIRQALWPSHSKKIKIEGILQTAFSVWFVAVIVLAYWNN